MFHILVLTSEMWFKKMLMIIMFSEVGILDCNFLSFFFFELLLTMVNISY